MFKKAKEFADKSKTDIIVTGEVLGERPMSQMKKSMNLIEEATGLSGRLLRPLSAKLLKETEAEKKGLVDRKMLLDIQGRRRDRQISIAKKFNMAYPTPAGGCMLCEKELTRRFNFLLNRGLNEDEINFVGVGRHFLIDNCWVVLGKDEKENKLIEFAGKKYNLIIPEFVGPSAIIFNNPKEITKEKINELIKSYSKNSSLEQRKKFEKWKL